MKRDPRSIIDINQDPGLSRQPILPKKIKLPIDISTFHWTRDKPDPRDYKYALSAPKILSGVDLRPYCSAIENQGNLGSCTGQAIAGAIELLNKRNQRQTDVSRLYIYYYERMLMGTINYDSGAYIRDGIKATNKYGAPLERLWPYDISKFRMAPVSAAIADGSKRKVTLYERVANFNGCLDALSNGYPVVAGFLVYESFMSQTVSRTGIMTYPNKSREQLLGGHAVLIVGYNQQKQSFIVRNSWGPYWGDKGYFYMPFSVIQDTTMSSDFWIIKSVLNP